jgi:hypothetical protein
VVTVLRNLPFCHVLYVIGSFLTWPASIKWDQSYSPESRNVFNSSMYLTQVMKLIISA